MPALPPSPAWPGPAGGGHLGLLHGAGAAGREVGAERGRPHLAVLCAGRPADGAAAVALGPARPGWHRLGRGLLLALLAGLGFSLLFMSGFMLAPLTHGAVIAPAFQMLTSIALGAWLLHQRPSRETLFGALFVVLGLGFMGGDSLLQSEGGLTIVGDLLFAVAGSCWAVRGLVAAALAGRPDARHGRGRGAVLRAVRAASARWPTPAGCRPPASACWWRCLPRAGRRAGGGAGLQPRRGAAGARARPSLARWCPARPRCWPSPRAGRGAHAAAVAGHRGRGQRPADRVRRRCSSAAADAARARTSRSTTGRSPSAPRSTCTARPRRRSSLRVRPPDDRRDADDVARRRVVGGRDRAPGGRVVRAAGRPDRPRDRPQGRSRAPAQSCTRT